MPTAQSNISARPGSSASGTLELTPAMLAGGGAVLLVIFVSVFWHFFFTQFRIAIGQPADWGHILVIPFVSAWFIWLRRDELMAKPFRPAWLGLGVVVFGVLWYSVALLGPSAFQHGNIQGIGVAFTLAGLCLLLFGWRSAKYLWFPVAYWAVFGQAIAEGILQKVTLTLQDWAARGAYFMLNATGFDTDISGNILTVYGGVGEPHPLNVAEACSGMRMLVAFLALGVAMAHLGLDRWWQRTILVLMAIPVALAVNILRVATLGVLSLRDINMVQGEFHHFVGMVWLIPGFIMFLGIQWALRVLGEPTVPSKETALAR
jgi:exosortase